MGRVIPDTVAIAGHNHAVALLAVDAKATGAEAVPVGGIANSAAVISEPCILQLRAVVGEVDVALGLEASAGRCDGRGGDGGKESKLHCVFYVKRRIFERQ